MEGNILLRTKKKFIFNICKGILIVIAILFGTICFICLFIAMPLICFIIIISCGGSYLIYEFILDTWKESRKQVEAEEQNE